MFSHFLNVLGKRLWSRAGGLLRLVAGVLLILVGVLGLALPILPGWAFIALGIVVLAPNSRIAKWLKRAGARLKTWTRRDSQLPAAKNQSKLRT
jgi:uncharacterized membrane protein YbaN (DUF454 family)